MIRERNILFWIICGISKDTRVDASCNTVRTGNNDSVSVCADKLGV